MLNCTCHGCGSENASCEFADESTARYNCQDCDYEWDDDNEISEEEDDEVNEASQKVNGREAENDDGENDTRRKPHLKIIK